MSIIEQLLENHDYISYSVTAMNRKVAVCFLKLVGGTKQCLFKIHWTKNYYQKEVNISIIPTEILMMVATVFSGVKLYKNFQNLIIWPKPILRVSIPHVVNCRLKPSSVLHYIAIQYRDIGS